jgi:putative SOS response-associated peptidase YedK
MCGRYTHLYTWAEIRELYLLTTWPQQDELSLNYNVPPTLSVPVVRERGGERRGDMLRWGLVPYFAKGIPPKYSTINATVERIVEGASWRGPWKRGQRCILPASGFYEWHVNEDGSKTPFYITCVDQPIFGFAGLWDASNDANGGTLESCTIITMPPNPLMAQIHNVRQRMPAILDRAATEAWLAGTTQEAWEALKPYPAEDMVAWEVSRLANSPKNNHAGLIQPVRQASSAVPQPTAKTDDGQPSLDLPLLDPGEPIVE